MAKIKIGVILATDITRAAGGECFRAFQNKEGAFEMYQETDHKISCFYNLWRLSRR